jgi:hypothetical protein
MRDEKIRKLRIESVLLVAGYDEGGVVAAKAEGV